MPLELWVLQDQEASWAPLAKAWLDSQGPPDPLANRSKVLLVLGVGAAHMEERAEEDHPALLGCQEYQASSCKRRKTVPFLQCNLRLVNNLTMFNLYESYRQCTLHSICLFIVV